MQGQRFKFARPPMVSSEFGLRQTNDVVCGTHTENTGEMRNVRSPRSPLQL